MDCNLFNYSPTEGCGKTYIGARYVPKVMGKWDINKSYESLSIVVDEKNNSFTSRKNVPVGILLNDENFWVQTGNFEGLLQEIDEKYKKLIEAINGEITGIKTSIAQQLKRISDVEDGLVEAKEGISKNKAAIDDLTDKLATTTTNLATLTASFNTYKTDTDKAIKDMGDTVTILRNDFNSYTDKTDKTLASQKDEIEQIKNDIIVIGRRVEVVERSTVTHGGQISSILKWKDSVAPLMEDVGEYNPIREADPTSLMSDTSEFTVEMTPSSFYKATIYSCDVTETTFLVNEYYLRITGNGSVSTLEGNKFTSIKDNEITKIDIVKVNTTNTYKITITFTKSFTHRSRITLGKEGRY